MVKLQYGCAQASPEADPESFGNPLTSGWAADGHHQSRLRAVAPQGLWSLTWLTERLGTRKTQPVIVLGSLRVAQAIDSRSSITHQSGYACAQRE